MQSNWCTESLRNALSSIGGLESEVDGLANVHVQVAQSDGTLRFLHTVADGPCDESYGVQVAALAGLPRNVVERATDLLAFLEQQAQGAKAGRDGAPSTREQGQSSLLGTLQPLQCRRMSRRLHR